MKILVSSTCILFFLLIFVSGVIQARAYYVKCTNPESRCYMKTLTCPSECPYRYSRNPKAKVCYINCNSPVCKAECKHRKPNCNGPGAVCYDPRFIGGDGIVFYFHGKSNEHFSLVSDRNLQINARFIGHRPAGRPRDFTWIQALGILFNSSSFSVEATKAATWDNEIDHLKFSYNDEEIAITESPLSIWNSSEENVKVERISSKNGAVVTLPNVVEILVTAVPVTKEDDRIHSYQVPADDCLLTWRCSSDSSASPLKLKEYSAALTSLNSRIQPNKVWQCRYWVVKISTEPRLFFPLIAAHVFSILIEFQSKRIRHLWDITYWTAPINLLVEME